MPPQLTEAWGVVYLHILAILLVFAFGVPALIDQLTLPEEIRHILRTTKIMKIRHFLFWRLNIFAIIIAIIFLVFLWCFHPCDNSIVTYCKHLLSSTLITLALVISIVIWIFLIRTLSREKVIKRIKKILISGFKKREALDETSLNNLIYLGEKGKSGHDKKLVLEALKELAENIQNREKYKGSELREFLLNFATVLVNGENKGDFENFKFAGIIIEGILHNLHKKNFMLKLDAGLAYKALIQLSKTAMELGYDEAVLEYTDMSNLNEKAFFEIGLLALKKEKFIISLNALTKLEAKADEQLPITDEQLPITKEEKFPYLIGLLGHFWAYENTFTKQLVKQFFNRRIEFKPSLYVCLEGAIKTHFDAARYITAENIKRMKDKITRP